MKLGVLTPVFKRKGSNQDAKNYQGITITPTITKHLGISPERKNKTNSIGEPKLSPTWIY